MTHSPNRILESVSARALVDIERRLNTIELVHGQILLQAGAPVENVYFPHSGVISLVVDMSDADQVITGMTGRDGAWGAAAALEDKPAVNKAVVQISGLASTMKAEDLRKMVKRHRSFQSALIRYELFLLAQVQQSAACNAKHDVEQRMCRWLLRMRELTGQDDLHITQERLAQTMGVRRPTVTVVAAAFKKARLLKYSRGNVRILDVKGLSDVACECYSAVSGHYARLIR